MRPTPRRRDGQVACTGEPHLGAVWPMAYPGPRQTRWPCRPWSASPPWRCGGGPSSRMCWPMSRWSNQRMRTGVERMATHRPTRPGQAGRARREASRERQKAGLGAGRRCSTGGRPRGRPRPRVRGEAHQAPRASTASSKGSRCPASPVVSCPFPAMSTRSPGPASSARGWPHAGRAPPRALVRPPARPGQHVLDDGQRVLVARVVRREDRDIAQAPRTHPSSGAWPGPGSLRSRRRRTPGPGASGRASPSTTSSPAGVWA